MTDHIRIGDKVKRLHITLSCDCMKKRLLFIYNYFDVVARKQKTYFTFRVRSEVLHTTSKKMDQVRTSNWEPSIDTFLNTAFSEIIKKVAGLTESVLSKWHLSINRKKRNKTISGLT